MIAVVEGWRAGLFARSQWVPNIVSGLIVGVVALPLGLAFAIASGVRPEQGLYTSIIGGLVVSLFGGSRIQIAGPTGAFIVILAGVVARHGAGGLLVATLMAGVMLLAMGFARFGAAIRFIPDPVISGFTAGIAVIIWVGQWHDFFGLPHTGGEHFYEKLGQLLRVLPHLHPATTALALASMALLLFGPRIPGLARLPGPLIALVVATGLQAAFRWPGVATIGSAFGGIPRGLPHLTLPAMGFDQVMSLLPSAFTIAMLGAIESLLSAVVADGLAGTRHNSNQELIGQGLANIISPLFGGIAATGAIARTATNFRNGGTGPLAGIVHALTLVAVLLVAAPLAGMIPLCALAAILFVVAWNMSGAAHCVRMLRTAPRADAGILLITFGLTVMTDLVIAVNIGVILAMLQFLRRMASSVEIVAQDAATLSVPLPPGVLVYAIEGPFFFGAVDTLERALGHTRTDPRCLILRLGHVPFMDITGLQALQEAAGNLERRGVKVVFCEANMRVLRKLLRAGLLPRGGPRRYCSTLAIALERAG
ncbi:SulP family inorganic anion transporter [Lichenicoccus sp.]|uniref:SulP family inorganic anion transporter n=1 Tax=Lichenicoccus sp. TaxID=2781899 RepID=UPI003D0EE8B5